MNINCKRYDARLWHFELGDVMLIVPMNDADAASLKHAIEVEMMDASLFGKCICEPGLPIMADCPIHDPETSNAR